VQSGLIAPISEPVAETRVREWPPEVIHQKRKIAARRCIYH
jgi:hypothetical protein